MICPRCGAENPESGKFCDRCGASLEQKRACPRCGAESPQESKFCDQCGATLDLPRICPKCGVESNEDAKFCDECGTTLEAGITATAPTRMELEIGPPNEISKAPIARVRPDVPQETPAVMYRTEEPSMQRVPPITGLSEEKAPWGWITLLVVSILGGWPACSILAGINWRRMGIPGRTWPTIIGPTALYIWWIVRGPETGFFSEYYGGAVISFVFAIFVWFWQKSTYSEWKQEHPDAQQAGWQTPLIVLLVFIIIQIIALVFFSLL